MVLYKLKLFSHVRVIMSLQVIFSDSIFNQVFKIYKEVTRP